MGEFVVTVIEIPVFAVFWTWLFAKLPPRRILWTRLLVFTWLAGSVFDLIVFTVARVGGAAAASGVNVVAALVFWWWRRKRPDRAVRAFGAKSLARLRALAERMPGPRGLVPEGSGA